MVLRLRIYLIQTRTNWIFFVFRKPLSCRPEKLMFWKNSPVLSLIRLISTWPWLLIFEIDDFPDFSLEGIISLIDLCLKVRLHCLRGKNRRGLFFILLLQRFRGINAFKILMLWLFGQHLEPFFAVETPVQHSSGSWNFPPLFFICRQLRL